jgi:IS5 family transposase
MPVFPKTLQYEIIETDFPAPRISGVCPESPPLDQIVDLDHPLAKLGRAIDWRFLEARFGAVYSDKPGQPPLPTRLMAGLSILKHTHNLSDEELCARFLENPYYQLFCGEEFFRHTLPFDRSSLTRWRQRMGEE